MINMFRAAYIYWGVWGVLILLLFPVGIILRIVSSLMNYFDEKKKQK